MTDNWPLAATTFIDKPHQVRSDSPMDGTGVCKICFREQRLNPPHPVNGWRVPTYYLTDGVCEECRLEQQAIYESSLCLEDITQGSSPDNWSLNPPDYIKLFNKALYGKQHQTKPILRNKDKLPITPEHPELKRKLIALRKGSTCYDMAKYLAEFNNILFRSIWPIKNNAGGERRVFFSIDDPDKNYDYVDRDQFIQCSWHKGYELPTSGCQKIIIESHVDEVKSYAMSLNRRNLDPLTVESIAITDGLFPAVRNYYHSLFKDLNDEKVFPDGVDYDHFEKYLKKCIRYAMLNYCKRNSPTVTTNNKYFSRDKFLKLVQDKGYGEAKEWDVKLTDDALVSMGFERKVVNGEVVWHSPKIWRSSDIKCHWEDQDQQE